MDPERSPDPTFRDLVEIAIAEDRPAVLVSLAPSDDGRGRTEIAVTDGMTRGEAAEALEFAAAELRVGAS